MKIWKTVDYDNVRIVWTCPVCGTEYVAPADPEEGVPYCPADGCGERECDYTRTEVFTETV